MRARWQCRYSTVVHFARSFALNVSHSAMVINGFLFARRALTVVANSFQLKIKCRFFPAFQSKPEYRGCVMIRKYEANYRRSNELAKTLPRRHWNAERWRCTAEMRWLTGDEHFIGRYSTLLMPFRARFLCVDEVIVANDKNGRTNWPALAGVYGPRAALFNACYASALR